MPIPTPIGALATAYRRLCVYYTRIITKSPEYKCLFDKPSSKKCLYYTSQNGTYALIYLELVPNRIRIVFDLN